MPIVLLLYWAVGFKKVKVQNIILLLASYFFYGLWDWRFLALILASSLVDYFVGLSLAQTDTTSKRKAYLYLSIIWNLGVLFIFKYYNFFINEFATLFQLDTENLTFSSLNIILPVGLSFYTFQTLSYSIDVFRRKIEPSTNIINFLCFVSFFPQLVAGPIERAKNLLPQFKKERSFSLPQVTDGLRQILWGLFKKVVIADNAALIVNAIYASPDDQGSASLLYASVAFFFQIYCDFSGYSDIAIGTAKLFGFRLSRNFNIPYLARSVAEFWQRWHITLTNWFTDYVYGPILKLKRGSTWLKTIALYFTMGLIGLWHGANWTFVVFGLFQALMISIERIPLRIGRRKVNINYYLNKMPLGFAVLYSFTLIITSCIFFRAETVEMAFSIIGKILSFETDELFRWIIGGRVWLILALVALEYFTRTKNHPFENLEAKVPKYLRWIIYYIVIFFILRYAGPKEEFIYFQF